MLSWDETDKLIKNKELDKLTRSHEQSVVYHAAKARFQQSHGGTAEYVISERLKWTGENIKGSGKPFLEHDGDLKLLKNDFSYDFEPGMQHLVLWSKVPIPCGSDELPDPEATEKIEQYLNNYFTSKHGIPRCDILWFKNPVVLQSIPSVSHFHILLRNCPDSKIAEIIN